MGTFKLEPLNLKNKRINNTKMVGNNHLYKDVLKNKIYSQLKYDTLKSNSYA